MRLTSSRMALLAVTVLVGSLAACGDDDDDSTSATTAAAVAATPPAATDAATPATTAAAADGAATTAAPAAGGAVVAVADTSLGSVLVDGDGLTLYVFTPDAQGPSTCSGDCLAAWPALKAPATAGDGVDETLLGTAAGTDGSEQVTYNGWPLYTFAQDKAPGDVTGQDVNGKWYVIDATGTMIES